MKRLLSFLTRRETLGIIAAVLLIKLFILGIALLHPLIPFGKCLNEGNYIYRLNTQSFLHRFEGFDGQWYLRIAELGYQRDPVWGELHDYAFFPLYPGLVSLLNHIFRSATFSALFVSYLSTFLMAIILYHLIRLDNDEKTSHFGVIYLLLFPTAFFFSSVYTEAVYMLFVVGSFYAARKNRWLIASLSGFMAALTRYNGMLLVIPLAFLYLEQRKFSLKNIRSDFLSLLIIPLATLFFAFFISLFTGSISSIFEVQGGWGRHLSFPLQPLFEYWNNLAILSYANGFLDRIFSIVFLILLIPMWKASRKEYWIYSFLVIMAPLSTGSTFSMMRFLLTSFPHFIYLSQITRGENSRVALASLFCGILSLFVLLFVNWYWVG